MSNKTIKVKIVEHLADEAHAALQDALNEVVALQRRPEFLDTQKPGPGLDLAVLKEKLERGMKFVKLLQ